MKSFFFNWWSPLNILSVSVANNIFQIACLAEQKVFHRYYVSLLDFHIFPWRIQNIITTTLFCRPLWFAHSLTEKRFSRLRPLITFTIHFDWSQGLLASDDICPYTIPATDIYSIQISPLDPWIIALYGEYHNYLLYHD